MTTLFTCFRSAIIDLSIKNKLPWNEIGFKDLPTIKKDQISTLLTTKIELVKAKG